MTLQRASFIPRALRCGAVAATLILWQLPASAAPDDDSDAVTRLLIERGLITDHAPTAAIEAPQVQQTIPPGKGAYRAKASATTLMRELAGFPKTRPAEPLLGAHVIVAGAATRHGVAARALRAMGVDPQALAGAARAEIAGQ